MMIADLTNGAFEMLGGLMILNHCRAVWRDKAVAGVSILSTVFFTAWGFWNLYYYPSLDQWWSFAGGLSIVSANVLWIALLLRYRKPANVEVQGRAAGFSAERPVGRRVVRQLYKSRRWRDGARKGNDASFSGM